MRLRLFTRVCFAMIKQQLEGANHHDELCVVLTKISETGACCVSSQSQTTSPCTDSIVNSVFHCLLLRMCLFFIVLYALDMLLIKATYLLRHKEAATLTPLQKPHHAGVVSGLDFITLPQRDSEVTVDELKTPIRDWELWRTVTTDSSASD